MWRFVVFLALLLLRLQGAVHGLAHSDLYPFGYSLDQHLNSDLDDTSSSEVQLAVPVVFYGTSYNTIFVNDNGLLSFLTEVPVFFNAQFPLTYPIIAPLYSDVDTRGAGRVYYRETQASDLLDRASRDVRRHFSRGSNFFARGVFIATWDGVGHFDSEKTQVNTFQVIIASDGEDSYAFFLYPEGAVQWIQGQGKVPNQPDARAQAGFMSGDGRLYTLRGSGTDQARNFDRMSNVQKPGTWMFHIGRTGLDGNVLPADLDTETDRPEEQFCANTLLPCPPTSSCVDHEGGFCCVCRDKYFGNGRNCLEKNTPQRMNGKVTGTINDDRIHDVDLHAYIVTEDGRTYTAISRVAPSLGYDMQSLTTLGGVIGWLFAVPRSGASNGFMITGGTFNRTVDVSYPQTGHHMHIEEQHLGPDVFNYMRVNVNVRGTVPSIPHGSKIDVKDYEEEFTRVAPGTIRSHSSRAFSLEGNVLEIPFVLDQTISFTECSYDRAHQETARLKVARNFIVYDDREQIVRYAMTNKISPLTTEDPCKEGRYQCGPHSTCVVEGDSFRCVCDQGYEIYYDTGDRATCIDVNECASGRHNCHVNADCINMPGAFHCRCLPGFTGDGTDCQTTPSCGDLNCDVNAECVDLPNQIPVCRCRAGYQGDGNTCKQVDNALDDCRRYSYCDPNAECVPNQAAQKYQCQCRPGYVGDGVICREETCDIAQNCHVDAECIYDRSAGDHYCACRPGYSGDGYSCVAEDAFSSCNVLNSCHPHAQCVYISSSNHYECRCNAGYSGDGYQCTKLQDVGCDSVNLCSVQAQCVYDSYFFKYTCVCDEGYEGDGVTCTPIDECNTVENCNPNAQCVYDSFSQRYRCKCNPGYVGDGKQCIPDTDVSCNIRNNCHQDARCLYDSVNLQYRCQCNPGFQGDGYTCSWSVISCNVVNTCSVHADCQYDPNSQGYRCRCRSGYDGDGHTCRPVRSCQEDRYQCDFNADCVYFDTTGEYVCQCKQGYTGDGYSCSVAPQHAGNFLLFAQGMSLLRMPLNPTKSDRGKLLLMEPSQTAVGVDVDCIDGKVYWTDIAHRAIRRANYDGSDAELVLSHDLESPEGVAVDWISRNLYWTDSSKDTIEVAKMDGTDRKVLISDRLYNPRGIAIHPGLGRMYWTDWNRSSPHIESANMDGTERAVIVKDNLGLPNMITIDLERNELCWTDAGLGRIECVGLRGENRRIIYTPAAYPFGIAVTGGKIFWTDWNIKFIQKVDRNGGTADPLEIPLGGNGKLYGVVVVPSYCPAVGNACAIQNGGCRYLCLPDGRGGRTCVCPDTHEGSDDVACNEV